MSSQHILIIDGNKPTANQQQQAMGGKPTGEGYKAVLQGIDPSLSCSLVQPAYKDYSHNFDKLKQFDGAVVTGSALHIYDQQAEVQNQLELVAEVFNAGVPVFGSCWGLQVACVVLGGKVGKNPCGMELGIARGIRPTAEGATHALLAGKAPVFDAVAIHTDEIEQLPPGSTLLASNNLSHIQAVEIIQGDKHFWGVQYHPEFSLFDMATIFLRYQDELLQDNFFTSSEAVKNTAEDFQSLHHNPDQLALSWRYGLDDSVLDFHQRTREIGNWLHYLQQRKQ